MDPITASESGNNAYYLGECRFAEHNPPYASCLDKIKRVRAGDKGVASYCVEPIKTGMCQAVHMRKAEELAGYAMYFIPREQWMAGIVKAPPWAVPPDQSPVTKEASKPTKAPIEVTVGGSYADAINEAMKSSVAPVSHIHGSPEFELQNVAKKVDAALAKPAPAPTPVPAPVASAQPMQRPPRLPGENPVQYAKRCAAMKKGSTDEQR